MHIYVYIYIYMHSHSYVHTYFLTYTRMIRTEKPGGSADSLSLPPSLPLFSRTSSNESFQMCAGSIQTFYLSLQIRVLGTPCVTSNEETLRRSRFGRLYVCVCVCLCRLELLNFDNLS